MYMRLVNNHKQLKTIDNYIAARYALYIELRYIEVRNKNGENVRGIIWMRIREKFMFR